MPPPPPIPGGGGGNIGNLGCCCDGPRASVTVGLPTPPILISDAYFPPPYLLPLSPLLPTPPPPQIPGGGAGNNESLCRCGNGPGACAANNGSPWIKRLDKRI